MNRSKRTLAVILALILMLSLLPFGVFAQTESASRQAVYINPDYADVLDESDIPQPTAKRGAGQNAVVYSSIEEAAAAMREQLKNRVETIAIAIETPNQDDDYYFGQVYQMIYDLAVQHTGVPTEGESLARAIGAWSVEMMWSFSGGMYRYEYQYTVPYYTTYEQEQELNALVADALAAMSLDGMTREQKIRTIYSYVCNHVTYDHEHDSTYKLRYTAYAALANGTAVCQGYALLIYRLMLEAGIDCQYIRGVGNGGSHAWNIVKLGGIYYCEDATWDSIWTQSGLEHAFELRGIDTFEDHTRGADYTTESFIAAYPTSDVDYVSGSAMDQDGFTYIVDQGSAVVTEYDVFHTGAAEIPAELGGRPVSAIGFRAFDRCLGVTSVAIPATVTAVDDYAFSVCNGLTHVWFGGTEAAGNAVAIESHNEPLLNAAVHFAEPTACQHSETTTVGAVDPTCTETGYTGDTVCASCGESISTGEVIPALGHIWDEGVVTLEPTETAEGVKTFTCMRCGEKRTEAIPALEPSHNNPFTDVTEGRFFYDPVLWAFYHDPQITDGVTPTTFMPDRICTRAHVVTFLWRANGCPEPASMTNSFKDVPNGKYYTEAVLWASEQGITTGYDDGTFRPDAECTRGQVVTFLWRANGEQAPMSSNNPFVDVSPSAYYDQAVLWARENGITDGRTPTTFGPTDACTRGHVVTFLYRAYA